MAMVDSALKYADLGWRLIPLHHDGPKKGVPHIEDWPTLASSSRKQVVEWWRRWPTAWIGVLTGADSGLLVVDLDVKGGLDGIGEWQSLIPSDWAHVGPVVQTRSGGRHIYFASNKDYKGSVGWRPGIDIRSWHNLVVAPPSGGRRWLVSPTETPRPVPPWLDRLLTSKAIEANEPADVGERSHLADLLANPPGATDVGWNDWLIKVAGHYAKLIPYEDAYRTLVDQAAEGLDGSWESGQVEKVADSAWSTEQSKTGEPPGGRVELQRIRAREWAANQHLQEQFDEEFELPPTFTWAQEREIDEGELPFTIAEIHPQGSNSLLTAQFKSGKTTFLMNLAVSLVDGRSFLGRFPVGHVGNVGFLNYELSARQFRDWARHMKCDNLEKIHSMHLRGHRLPFWNSRVEDLLVQWLRENEIRTLIADPWARVFSGAGDENSNSDAGRVLETLDVIKERAEVLDLFLATHTGRGIEGKASNNRTRGATRLDDWPDALWTLEKDGSNRWFSAIGRDVGIEQPLRVDFNKESWSLSAVEADRTVTSAAETANLLRQWIRDHPGANRTTLDKQVSGGKERVEAGLKYAVEMGWIEDRGDGKRRSWYTVDREEG